MTTKLLIVLHFGLNMDFSLLTKLTTLETSQSPIAGLHVDLFPNNALLNNALMSMIVVTFQVSIGLTTNNNDFNDYQK